MTSIRERNFLPELMFQTSRSSGKGGQNVNKVESRVELFFDVDNSLLLSNEEKAILKDRIPGKITTFGVLFLSSQVSRSQLENKELVIEKFLSLLEKSLAPKKKRRKTRPSKAAIEKRLESKKRQSEKKSNRRFDL